MSLPSLNKVITITITTVLMPASKKNYLYVDVDVKKNSSIRLAKYGKIKITHTGVLPEP